MNPKLAVIDTQWPGHIKALVRHLDKLGYHRFWTTEHHHAERSGSPTLLAALAAEYSQTMRVGTAGVLLNFYSPLKVVEDFRLLELLFPGRIDLGIAGGWLNKAVVESLLDGRPIPEPWVYESKARELVRLIRNEPPGTGKISGEEVGPLPSSLPELWVCGTSIRSAILAARLGMAYAFHHYLAQQSNVEEQAVINAYRSAFSPHLSRAEPYVSIACYGMCAETEASAQALWSAFMNHWRPVQPPTVPTFLGTPGQCKEQLLAVRDRYEADELVIECYSLDFDARLRAYEYLAVEVKSQFLPAK